MWQLQQRQSLPLEVKIRLSQIRIKDWYEYWEGDVYVSFSGGKDSTVLLHLVRDLYPKIPAVFFDTGLEYPEVTDFVKTIDNVGWVKPDKNFREVLKDYGYPVVSKEQSYYIEQYRDTKSDKLRDLRWNGKETPSKKNSFSISKIHRYLVDAPFLISPKCCDIMKKNPAKKYEKRTGRKPILGVMAGDSILRKQSYLKTGCNAFAATRQVSRPIMFWKEEDIWGYIKEFSLPYASIYDKGYDNTGCMFCMFGVQREKEPNRFQRMKESHPQKYKYCMENLGLKEVLEFMKVPYV